MPVQYELEVSKRKMVVIFKDGPVIEDKKSFRRTHYFVDSGLTTITTGFKDELVKLFQVSGVEELKERIDNNVKLIFRPGNGAMEYDDISKTVIVYTETFANDVVKPNAKAKRLKKNIEKLSKGEKISSREFTDLVGTIANGVDDVELSTKDKQKLAEEIPRLIRSGSVKISLKDITDINKDRLKDVVQLGRDLLSKKIGVEKRLGIEREYIGKEYAWQKFFELYGSYLLFGSIEEKVPEEWISAKSKLRNGDSRLDFLTINRYGFLDIVELKRSDEFLFKLDASHDNIVPTPKLSTAISQVNNYLMMLPYDSEKGNLVRGAESATGMLVIGSGKSLMREDAIRKYANKDNMTANTVRLKARKALRDLNYSYAHIQIVLYDELLDNLENFINQMKIEIKDI